MQRNKLTVLLFFLFFTTGLFSQVQKQENNIFIPEDDLLINGRLYIPVHYKAQGNPYFEKDEWMLATIYTMGEVYENQIVKYNIESGRLILNSQVQNKYYNIELNTQNIDSFKVVSLNALFPFNNKNKDDYDFIRKIISQANNRLLNYKVFISIGDDFYQKIYFGKFTFLKKFEKEFKNIYTEHNHFGLYTNQKFIYFIYDDSVLTEVNTKKQFINFFGIHRKDVRKYLLKNKINYRKTTDDVLFQLMIFCNSLIK